ncbi:phage holin family protein [Micromonospora sp. STR1s_5]|nr:phage holin family protein [Micromonospora sp. STR1s_5]
MSAPEKERTQASVGELLGEVTRDVSTLMRKEVELAKAELREEVSQAGKAGGMFGGAGVAGFLAVLFVSYALWWGLSNTMDQGWAALIVAVLWAAVAGGLFINARTQLKRARGGVLPRTQQTARELPDALRGR